MAKEYDELEFLSVLYLYYDGYDKNNIELHTILANGQVAVNI